MIKRRTGKLAIAFTALPLIFGVIDASAAPPFLTHQGRLFQSDGAPVEGAVTFTFSIYAEKEGGEALWTETHDLTLEGGYFSTILGEDQAIDQTLFDGTIRYLGIAINGETSAAIRDKGAPLGFRVLSPKIVKPEGLFLARNAPHPHATLLFAEWVLSEEAQAFLATTLGKGSAMKGVRSKYKEFQLQPDFVVTPKLGPKLQAYVQEFAKIMNIP